MEIFRQTLSVVGNLLPNGFQEIKASGAGIGPAFSDSESGVLPLYEPELFIQYSILRNITVIATLVALKGLCTLYFAPKLKEW